MKNYPSTVIERAKEYLPINVSGNMVVDEKLNELRSSRDRLKAYVRSFDDVTYWSDDDADEFVADWYHCNQAIEYLEKEIEQRKEVLISIIEAYTRRLEPKKTPSFV